jgi:CDP-glucose 4,6-dehydratase
MFNDVYRGKKVLVTGHCGFKGSWLTRWLQKLGCQIIGYGHSPRMLTSHFQLLYPLRCYLESDDLLDFRKLQNTINTFRPDIVFHLAAKAIVSRTFHEPRETFENNVMGTVNLLEACRDQPSIKGIVCITTDKVYENKEWDWGYRENDSLGGLDPYSASKVCIEHVIKCYRTQFIPHIATARAGNVIGGGDWAEKRLIPDIVRATARGDEVEIHTPNATRPWQHVLEPLAGYLTLGQKFLEGVPMVEIRDDIPCCPVEDILPGKIWWQMPQQKPTTTKLYNQFATNWNFGPDGEMTVLDILKIAQEVWPKVKYVIKEEETHPSMVELLRIDSTEAKKVLGWKPRLNMENAVRWTIDWYKNFYENGKISTDGNIEYYEKLMEQSL